MAGGPVGLSVETGGDWTGQGSLRNLKTSRPFEDPKPGSYQVTRDEKIGCRNWILVLGNRESWWC